MNKELKEKKNYFTWIEIAKKWQKIQTKILNIMNGAEFGGAELFFLKGLLYHLKKEQVLVKKF